MITLDINYYIAEFPVKCLIVVKTYFIDGYTFCARTSPIEVEFEFVTYFNLSNAFILADFESRLNMLRMIHFMKGFDEFCWNKGSLFFLSKSIGSSANLIHELEEDRELSV
jgi:hypothetical protein